MTITLVHASVDQDLWLHLVVMRARIPLACYLGHKKRQNLLMEHGLDQYRNEDFIFVSGGLQWLTRLTSEASHFRWRVDYEVYAC